MDFIITELLSLILEEVIEASIDKKSIPKVIRRIVALVILLLFISAISLIIFVGISTLKDNVLGGIFIILFGIFILILSIIRFIKIYNNKKML